jgi:tryptophan synthase alpha subunit
MTVTGITGARKTLPDGLQEFVARVRRYTGLPLAVGFGISSREQVTAVGSIADGVIVGSALIDEVNRALERGMDPGVAAGLFLAELKGESSRTQMPDLNR